MPKVLHVDSWGGIGGGQTVLAEIVAHASTDVTHIVVAPDGEMMHRYKKLGASIDIVSFGSFYQAISGIIKNIKKYNPDVIHAHGIRAAIYARIAKLCTHSHAWFVYTVHGFHIAQYPFFKRIILTHLERILNFFATDVLVAVSDHDATAMTQARIINTKKIVTIKNGISVTDVRARASEEKQKNKIFTVVSVSRLHAPKDIKTVIHAVKKVSDAGYQIQCNILGDGPDRAMLEAEVKNMQLEGQVLFLGYQSNPLPYINQANALIFSSFSEGLPMALLESAALKTAIIATDIAGVREIVRDRTEGLLFEVGDADTLAQILTEAIDKKIDMQPMIDAAYTRVCLEFDVQHMVYAYEKIYKSVPL